MQPALIAALEPHRAWLAKLRWVGRWEPAGIILALVGTVLAAICGGVYLGLAECIALLAGHGLALAAILAASGRGYTPALLALIGLSGLHVWLWLMQGLPHGHEIALGYVCAGTGLAALAGVIARRNEARWQALAKAQERDDFRWLVTRAPLLLRWRMSRWLRAGRE